MRGMRTRYPIKTLIFYLAVFLWTSPGARAAEEAPPEETPPRGWQQNAMREIMARPIGYGEALYWRLGDNSFAVKVPGYFIVFDYADDIPTGQWEFGKRLEGKELNRSLLTGVFEPEEFEDLFPNDIVLVLYSHLHPAEKTLSAAFDWSRHFKKVIYIGPPEVRDLYGRVVRDEIESQKNEGLEAIDEPIVQEDALAMFRTAKPELPVSVGGLTIRPYAPHDPIAEEIGEAQEGLEYVVETDNGVDLYHSGALGCRVCLDGSEFLSVREAPKVMSATTQNIVYCRNKIIKINGKRVDICPGEEKRIGFALYTPQGFDGAGAITVWADGRPDLPFPTSHTGITDRNGKLTAMEDSFLDQAAKDPFGEYDIEASEILKQRLNVEEEYRKKSADRNPRSIFQYTTEGQLLMALQGNTTYANQRGRLDVRDRLHEIQSDLVMKAFHNMTLPPKLDWFPLILTDEPRGEDCPYTKSSLFMQAFLEGTLPLKLNCFPLAMPNLPRGYCHHFNRIIYFTGYVLGSYPELWRSSSDVVKAYAAEEERRRQEAVMNGRGLVKIRKTLTTQRTTQDYIKERKDALALKEAEALQKQEQEAQEARAEEEEPEPQISKLEEYRLEREASKKKTAEMKFRRDLQEERENLQFGKVSVSIKPHYVRYRGTVTNKGKWNKNFLTVKMSFLDGKGEAGHYEKALTHPLHLKPYDTATFTVYTERTDPLPEYELSATWDLDEANEDVPEGFSR